MKATFLCSVSFFSVVSLCFAQTPEKQKVSVEARDVASKGVAPPPQPAQRAARESQVGQTPKAIPEFRTSKQVYRNVVIKSVEPDGIRLMHESGAAKVPFDDLTPEQRATYGITEENRAAHLKRQEAAKLEVPIAPRPQQPVPERTSENKGKPVRYVTPQEIKVYWYRKLPEPANRLDRGYAQMLRAREEFVAEIRAGAHDLAAEKTASMYNKEEALRVGDQQRANLCESEIARITQQEAEIARQKQEDRRSAQLRLLDSRLSEINRNMRQQRNEM